MKPALIDPGVGRIGGNDPEAFDLASFDSVNDLIIGPARFGGDASFGDFENAGNLGAMIGVGEIVTAEKVGGVGEETGTHRVALTGDGVGAGAGLANVAGHEAKVDDGLGGPDSFVRLVDAHRPPHRDALGGIGDELGKGFNFESTDLGILTGGVGRVGAHEASEVFKVLGVILNKFFIDPRLPNDAVGEGVEEGKVALGFDLQVLRCDLCGLGDAGIDDDDLGVPFVACEALVKDGVGDGEIGADEDDDVRFFEVGVAEGRSVETEGLLVGDDGGGHALAGISVAVFEAHSKLGEGSEEGHFFGRDLSGREKGDGIFSVGGLNLLELVGEDSGGKIPGKFSGWLVAEFFKERGSGAFGRVENREGFPTFGAGHPEIDGVGRGRGQADGFAFVKVEVELASGGTESADRSGGAIGFEITGEFSEAEVIGSQEKFGRQGAGLLFKELIKNGRHSRLNRQLAGQVG